jgi:predicted ATPase
MISSLHLLNFKCFEDQSFPCGPLTLLAGLNGMGKSSILQSLLLLRQSRLDGLLDRAGLSLNGKLIELGTARDIFYEGAAQDDFGFRLNIDPVGQAAWKFRYDRQADVAQQISLPVPEPIYRTGLFSDQFHYLQAERIGPRSAYAMSDYEVSQHHQVGARGEYTAHFLALYGTQDIPIPALAHPKASAQSLKSQVEAWMGEISPGIQLALTAFPDLNIVNLKYSFAQGGQVSNGYRPVNVGFGISYALHVVVALLSSAPGHLVLLENPEAHLHPYGQARIGELIARAAQSGVQVILETHSDHVLNGVRLTVHDGLVSPETIRLYYLDRNVDGTARVLSPRIDSNGRIDRWPDGFFDEWDKSLERLLKAGDE